MSGWRHPIVLPSPRLALASRLTHAVGSGAEAWYTCELQNHTLSPPSSFQIDGTWMPFSVEYRAAIYSGDEIVYADGGSWETERRSAN